MRLLILGKRSACRWCVVVAILVALVVGVVCSWPSSGRRIQGRTLVEWLQQLECRSFCDLALGGVRVLGTNVAPIVPRLVQDLRVWKTSYPAARALGTVGGAAVVPVVEMLESRTNSGLPWRWPFACGLQFAPPKDADVVVPALVRALQDPEVEVQIFATQALKKFRGHEREFVPQILLNLRSPVNRVREISAETLWALRRKDAIPQLKPLLSDPDPNVRAAVKRALQDLER